MKIHPCTKNCVIITIIIMINKSHLIHLYDVQPFQSSPWKVAHLEAMNTSSSHLSPAPVALLAPIALRVALYAYLAGYEGVKI